MSSKMKLTNQRQILLNFIQNNHTHPTVDDIFKQLRRKLPRISKKTVYNNLKVLCENGFVKEIRLKGVKRYEPVMGPHHHLLCRFCNVVSDVEHKGLTKCAIEVGDHIQGFEVESVSVNFYGVCKKCREERSDDERER